MRPFTIALGALFLLIGLATCAGRAELPVAGLEAATSSAATTVVVPAGAAGEAPAIVTLSDIADVSLPTITPAAVSDIVDATTVVLAGADIAVDGPGVTVEEGIATITAAGTYVISGILADGQLIVDTEDVDPVQLVLSGVELHSTTGAPLFVRKSAATVIVLADGTENLLDDAATYRVENPEDDEPNAALFSKADLTITGSGALTVQGNYNDGIASKDGLSITGGSITVRAADDGVRGKDYVIVQAGSLIIDAAGDGLKSDNEEDSTLGYILVDSGTIQITAGGDAIVGQSNVVVRDGELILSAGGGSAASIDETLSAKGIKAEKVQIDGGVFAIDAADDALHANVGVTINGGSFAITSGDDGIHADETVTINDGDLRITGSYEGVEGSVITLNGGAIHVTSSDDGINVSGGVDGSGMMRGGRGGMPGSVAQDVFTYTGDDYLYINGGYIVVDAGGDGLDANGAIKMSGGVVIVNGPTMNMNGALDYDGGFAISGGVLITAGSAGMAQAPGGGSTQNALLLNYGTTQPAGTLVHIQDSQGNALLTFAPSKQYQSITFSSPDLAAGETYAVYSGGSSSGTAVDGLVMDGVYMPGSEYTTFTAASGVTQIGARTR